jgi:two-component system phosphate regulon response regulator PhoB
MSRVLVVEDESAIAELIAINLRHAGHEVTLAASAEQAQHAIDGVLPDLVLLDWMLPGQSAWRWRAAGAPSPHARAAHHHADGARRRGRQGGRPGRRRRRLHGQAVLHQGAAGAHPRRAAPQGARGAGRPVEVAGLRLDPATRRVSRVRHRRRQS